MLEIPYARYVQVVRRIAIETARENREEFKRAAFIGWQNFAATGGKANYNEYLGMLGLADKEPEHLEPAKEFDKEAFLARMARIVEIDLARDRTNE